MVAVFEGLAQGTKVGRPVDIREGYFKYCSGSHMIYFQRTPDGIVVIRVLHQMMDVTKHLNP